MSDKAEFARQGRGEAEPPLMGHAFVFQWLSDTWGHEVTRGVVQQFLVFYGLLLLGFCFLYLMMRSTSQIRELRKSMAAALTEQRNRKTTIDDFRSMPGAGFL